MTMPIRHLICGVVVLVLAGEAAAFRSGAPLGRTGSPASGGSSCRACHGNVIGSGSVQILGAPAEYALDALYDLTIRVSDPGQAGAGFEISVETPAGVHVGTLILSDTTNTRFSTGSTDFVTHTSTGVAGAVAGWVANGNTADYHLQWMAPSSDMGTITFWAAGNAINNNFTNSGDIIYLTNVSAVPPGPEIAGDIDGDGDVDLQDFASFSVCFGADVEMPPEGCSPADAAASDLDGDGIVDLVDFATFAGNFGT